MQSKQHISSVLKIVLLFVSGALCRQLEFRGANGKRRTCEQITANLACGKEKVTLSPKALQKLQASSHDLGQKAKSRCFSLFSIRSRGDHEWHSVDRLKGQKLAQNARILLCDQRPFFAGPRTAVARLLQTQVSGVQNITFSRQSQGSILFTLFNFATYSFKSNINSVNVASRFSTSGSTTFQYSSGNSNGGIVNTVLMTVPSTLSSITFNFDTACYFPIVAASSNAFPALTPGGGSGNGQSFTINAAIFGIAQTQNTQWQQASIAFPNLSAQQAQSYGLFSQSISAANNGGNMYTNLLIYCPILVNTATAWTMNIVGSVGSSSGSSSSSSSSSDTNYTGLIIGVVIGGVVLIALIVIAVICVYAIRKRQEKAGQKVSTNPMSQTSVPDFQTAGGDPNGLPYPQQQVTPYKIMDSQEPKNYPALGTEIIIRKDEHLRNDLNRTRDEQIPITNIQLEQKQPSTNEIRTLKESTR